jgi:hypothetical protein
VQYEEALYECYLSAEEDKGDFERMSVLRYKGDIEDYITQKTYNITNLGLKGPAWVAQIALGLPFWFNDCCSMKLGRTYDEEIMRNPLRWLAFIMRKDKGTLSTRRSLKRPRARKPKIREKALPNLTL